MIFGNSDPAFFAIFVSAEAEQGQDATRLLERLRVELWDGWLRPPLAALFGRPKPRRRSQPLARPLPGFRPENFEVLASYPVDRANPPATLAARLRQLRQARQWRNPGHKINIAVTERELPSPPLFVRRGEGTTATTTPPLSSPNGAEDDHLVVLCPAPHKTSGLSTVDKRLLMRRGMSSPGGDFLSVNRSNLADNARAKVVPRALSLKGLLSVARGAPPLF